MGSFLFTEFQTIFGGGAIDDTANFMKTIIGALRNVFADNGAVTQGMALFLGIAGLIAIIGYFMELWNLSAKDLLSFDKMVVSFIKIVFVLIILVFSQDLIVGAFNVCSAGYDYVAEEMPKISNSSDDVKITYFGQSEIPEHYTDPLKDPVDSVTEKILESESDGNDTNDDDTEVSMQTIFECKKVHRGRCVRTDTKNVIQHHHFVPSVPLVFCRTMCRLFYLCFQCDPINCLWDFLSDRFGPKLRRRYQIHRHPVFKKIRCCRTYLCCYHCHYERSFLATVRYCHMDCQQFQ